MTYLHRFFDKQISLQRPSIDALVRGKLENHASEEFCKVARYAIDCYKFHIRETLQFLDELDDVCGAISYLVRTQNLKNDIEFDYDPEEDRGSTVYNAETNAYFFAFDIIIPLLIGLRIKDRNVYDAVLNDKAVNEDVSEHIQRYFRENSNGLWLLALGLWITSVEALMPVNPPHKDSILDRIYSAMFPLVDHDATVTVGWLDFSKRVRERVKELLSGLAKQGQEKESWGTSHLEDLRYIIEKTGKIAGEHLIISETVQMEFVWCPAGTFMMGSPKDELGRYDYGTQFEKLHEVRLTKGFWIGKYPVTQTQYKTITEENPSFFEGDTRPVESVSWFDSNAFCERLNELKIAPVGYRFALPTEAQWEYACRAGTTTALNNGKPLTSENGECPNLDEVGWYDGNTDGQTHPIGEKRPNAWGIYDMHGNVWEWCADWFGDYPRGEVTDPTGPETGECRVVRGGCCGLHAWICRSANRNFLGPDHRISGFGFRLALVPEQKTASA